MAEVDVRVVEIGPKGGAVVRAKLADVVIIGLLKGGYSEADLAETTERCITVVHEEISREFNELL